MPVLMRSSPTDRTIDLHPAYRLVTLRESGDAFGHACSIASDQGAGTLVWVRRFDLIEFAVVLEPEEMLQQARRACYAGSNALADALAAHAPPERPISFDWPDAIRVDGVLVGGCRLGWPAAAQETESPAWLVYSGMVRAFAVRGDEPGLRPRLGALDELGFEGIDTGAIVASFARHLVHGLHEWSETGFDSAATRWLQRMPGQEERHASLDDNGDLLIAGHGRRVAERRGLAAALSVPSWLDPATGEPWL